MLVILFLFFWGLLELGRLAGDVSRGIDSSLYSLKLFLLLLRLNY